MNDDRRENIEVIGLLKLVAIAAGIYFAYMLFKFALTMFAYLTVLAMFAAAVYYGFMFARDAALKKEIWEDRREKRYKKIEAQRKREMEVLSGEDKEWMRDLAEQYHDDQLRKLYEEPDWMGNTVNFVKKVKEIFK